VLLLLLSFNPLLYYYLLLLSSIRFSTLIDQVTTFIGLVLLMDILDLDSSFSMGTFLSIG